MTHLEDYRDDEVVLWRKDSSWGLIAEQVVRAYFPASRVTAGVRGDPYPLDLEAGEVSIFLSFSSPWIVKECDLSQVKLFAINFHPGSPAFPGIGCTNFAIYEGINSYGPTCHYMDKTVDTGRIIDYRSFSVSDSETVWSLTNRTYAHMVAQLSDIVASLRAGKQEFVQKAEWERKPYRRRDLESLACVYGDDTPREIARRATALDYPEMPGVKLCGAHRDRN